MLFGLFFVNGCNRFEPLHPYRAKVIEVSPNIPGLNISATGGFGGELKVENDTDAVVFLLNEEGNEYVKISSDAVFLLEDEQWVKRRSSNIYYWSPAVIVYLGPPPTDENRNVVKEWQIKGRVEEQTFLVNGQTIYVGK